MRRPMVFALPLLVAGVVLAQKQAPSSPSGIGSSWTAQAEAAPPLATNMIYSRSADGVVVATVEMRGVCPVGMSARQQGGGQTVWTIALEDAGKARGGGAGRGVHVQLKAKKGSPIRQVELRVDYLAPGWRVMPVGETERSAKPGDDLKKAYELGAEGGASLKLAGDLLVGATAGVTRVTLLRVEYADGTSWRAEDHEACSVAPNGFMLVGAR